MQQIVISLLKLFFVLVVFGVCFGIASHSTTKSLTGRLSNPEKDKTSINVTQSGVRLDSVLQPIIPFFIIAFIALAFLIILLWFLFAVKLYFFTETINDLALIGDSFGSLNALFSGLGLVGVAVALALQLQELRQSRKDFEYQTYLTSLSEHLARVAELDRSLADIPSALEFHNVSELDLKKAGLTAEEFAYLISSFTAGSTYYRLAVPDDKKAFAPDSYRYNMFLSERTRKAWPLVRKLLMPSNYRDKLDATMRLISKNKSRR